MTRMYRVWRSLLVVLVGGIAAAVQGQANRMELVEHEPEHARARLTRGTFLVGLCSNLLDRARILRQGAKLHRFDRTSDAVFKQLEVGGTEVDDCPPMGIGDDGVDADGRQLGVGGSGLRLLRESASGQHEQGGDDSYPPPSNPDHDPV